MPHETLVDANRNLEEHTDLAAVAGEQSAIPTATFKPIEFSYSNMPSAAFFGRADHYLTTSASIGNFYVAAGHVDKQQDSIATQLAATGSGLHSVASGEPPVTRIR